MELTDVTHILMGSHVGRMSGVEKPGEAGVEPRHVELSPLPTSPIPPSTSVKRSAQGTHESLLINYQVSCQWT
jgi:hypothetical protein